MNFAKLVGVAVFSLALIGGARAAVIIDDFNTLQNLQAGPGGVNPLIASGAVAAAGALGGARGAVVTRTSGAGVAALSINDTTPNFLSFSTDSNADADLVVIWDGSVDAVLNPAGLSVDLTEGGMNDRIRLRSSVDLAGVTVTIRVYSGAGNVSEFAQLLSPGGSLFTYDMLFAGFTVVGGSGANFSNVGAVTMSLTGPARMDLEVDFIEATTGIPEPFTFVLVGAGLAGFGLMRRRSGR